jgi:hypothetical protein
MDIPPPLQFAPVQFSNTNASQLGAQLGGMGRQFLDKRRAQQADQGRPHREFPNAQQAHQLDGMVGQPMGHMLGG